MSNLLKKYRTRRVHIRNARELQRAIETAPTPNVREELLIAAQHAARF